MFIKKGFVTQIEFRYLLQNRFQLHRDFTQNNIVLKKHTPKGCVW